MKEKIISFIFLGLLLLTGGTIIFTKDKEISNYERRKLTTSKQLKEDFIENIDKYMSDQFPLRDELISFNSLINRYILMNKEKNNVYILNGYLIEKNYPENEKNINNFITKINYIKEEYLKSSKVYYSIIPDKSYYLNEKHLKLDFNKIINKINNEINIEYINIIDEFKLTDYYKTDIHLKQNSYFKIMNKLNNQLNFNYEKQEYTKKTYKDFKGASLSKVGSYIEGETLEYFTNEKIENATVKHLEFGIKKVYDTEELKNVDSYNVFLSGPSSILEIDNKESITDKELIIFRDSFASSLTPLLIPYYKKITLIDLRYINMNIVSNYIDFNDKDVLFLYSTLIINNSNLLKTN